MWQRKSIRNCEAKKVVWSRNWKSYTPHCSLNISEHFISSRTSHWLLAEVKSLGCLISLQSFFQTLCEGTEFSGILKQEFTRGTK